MRLNPLLCAVAAVVAACAGPLACGGREPIDPTATSGAGVSGGGTIDTTTTDPATTQAALMTRWNAAADAAGTSIDFHWPSVDQFPHPTYKGGTAQAYQQFAAVLLLFFQRGDDFAFLAANHLFQTPLRYVFPSGQIGLDTTFQKLATDFSSSTGFGNIPDATRQGIKSFLDRMK